MLSFKQYILESGDSHYPFKLWSGTSNVYTFKDHNNKTKILEINKSEPEVAHVNFFDQDSKASKMYDATNDLGHRAIKVFSTVKEIMKHHVANNPGVKLYSFESNKNEKNRHSLYSKFTKRMGGETDNDDVEYATHTIPASSLYYLFLV